LYTTNGTRAVVKAKFSENLFICSFLNLSAIASHLINLNNNVEILCSGKANNFSMEDTICAGRLVAELQKLKDNIEITDSARASLALNKSFGKSIFKMLGESEHGKILIENNFEEDIKYCSKLNITDIIPYYTSNVIKVMPISKLINNPDK